MVAYIDDAHVARGLYMKIDNLSIFFIQSHLLLFLHVTWEFYMAKWCHTRKGR